jgi:hypothetical protein
MVAPATVLASGGLDPAKSREWCYPTDALHSDWPHHRFVFAFKYDTVHLPPKAAKGFANGGYMYILDVLAGSEFWCTGGKMTTSGEIGLPVKVSLKQITHVFQYQKGKVVPVKWKG